MQRSFSPPARLATSLLLIVAVATIPATAAGLAAAALLTAGVAVWRRPPLGVLLRRGLAAAGVLLALCLPIWLSDGAEALPRLLRAMLATTLALLSTASLHHWEVAAALSGLRLPPALTGTVETMLRQVTCVRDEAARLGLARKLRGATTATWSVDLLAVLFDRTLARAERAEVAARLRGYDMTCRPAAARWRWADAPLLLVASLAAISLQLVARS